MGYPKSVSFIKFVMDFYTCDNTLDTIWITDIKLLHFQVSKSGHILSADKTGFFPDPVTFNVAQYHWQLHIMLTSCDSYCTCAIILNTTGCW